MIQHERNFHTPINYPGDELQFDEAFNPVTGDTSILCPTNEILWILSDLFNLNISGSDDACFLKITFAMIGFYGFLLN